jgi:hypothetical protein
MLQRDDSVWQGATWMTEVKGGSDLGTAVETVARPDGSKWRLNGDKYFASNAGAELAVVAARPKGAPQNVRVLSLYLVPRRGEDGQLNYLIRRLKDKIATRSIPTGEIEFRSSEAWLLGQAEHGIYLILEVLNLSRVANTVGSVALAQRAIADAYSFAERRIAFGKPIIEHPLLTSAAVRGPSAGITCGFRAGLGSGESARQGVAGEAAVLGELSSVPAGSSPREVLDSRIRCADGQMGDGSARRGGNAAGISRGALAARSNDPFHLGRHIASPDAGWVGGHAAKKCAQVTVPASCGESIGGAAARDGSAGGATTRFAVRTVSNWPYC